MSKCSATPARIAATPLERDRVSQVQTTRDTLQGDPGWGATGPFEGGCSATPLRHPLNRGKSRDGGVATPLERDRGGVASAPLRVREGEPKGKPGDHLNGSEKEAPNHVRALRNVCQGCNSKADWGLKFADLHSEKNPRP